MFLKYHKYFWQLPLAIRLIIGFALGAVLVFLFIFFIGRFFYLPNESYFFPSSCEMYLRFEGYYPNTVKIYDIVLNDNGLSKINQAGTGAFSICQLNQNESLAFVEAKDKSIEKAIEAEGFFYKKIGKGKYIISKSEEALNIVKEPGKKLSSVISGKYKHSDKIFISGNKENFNKYGLTLLSTFCLENYCYLKGNVSDFVQFSNGSKVKAVDKRNDYLKGFDVAYNKNKNSFLCSDKIKYKLDIDIPLWINVLGMENFDNLICSDFSLAMKKRQDGDSRTIWQGYEIYLKVYFKDGVTEDKIKAFEDNVKKIAASDFPTIEEVRLNDGTKVSEIKINPEKLEFNATGTYRYLVFPDKSAAVYYKVSEKELIVSNNPNLIDTSLDFGKEDYIAFKADIENEIHDKFVRLFNIAIVKDNGLFLKYDKNI